MKKTIIANKEELFKVAAPVTEEVEVSPGTFVKMTEIPATEFVKIWLDPSFQADDKEGSLDMRKITPALIVRSIVDSNGDRIFTDDDAATIGIKIGTVAFLKLGMVARRLNGVVGVDSNEKNSEASQGNSSLDSPSN